MKLRKLRPSELEAVLDAYRDTEGDLDIFVHDKVNDDWNDIDIIDMMQTDYRYYSDDDEEFFVLLTQDQFAKIFS